VQRGDVARAVQIACELARLRRERPDARVGRERRMVERDEERSVGRCRLQLTDQLIPGRSRAAGGLDGAAPVAEDRIRVTSPTASAILPASRRPAIGENADL